MTINVCYKIDKSNYFNLFKKDLYLYILNSVRSEEAINSDDDFFFFSICVCCCLCSSNTHPSSIRKSYAKPTVDRTFSQYKTRHIYEMQTQRKSTKRAQNGWESFRNNRPRTPIRKRHSIPREHRHGQMYLQFTVYRYFLFEYHLFNHWK